MSFSNPEGVQWVDLILSKSHILGPFRSQNVNLLWLSSWGLWSASKYLQNSVYLEARQILRTGGRGGVKTFPWFLPSAWKMLNVESFFSRSCNGTISDRNGFCFITNGLCLLFNPTFLLTMPGGRIRQVKHSASEGNRNHLGNVTPTRKPDDSGAHLELLF